MIKMVYDSDTYNNYSDDDIIQNLLENDSELTKDKITDMDIYSERCFLSELDFDSESDNLNESLNNNIICIADLGLWHGRKSGYKILDNNLNSILRQGQGDYYSVFYDGFNLRAKDIHHDGTNYYTFRELKENTNYQILLDKLYQGTATKNDVNNYTSSLKKYVKRIYGW